MNPAPHILVVDDEAHILHVVSLKLRNAGYVVVTAPDGEEALGLARRRPFDLVITDYQMPFMTGVELCKQLRAEPKTASIPTLMLTAHGFALSDSHLADAGIAAVLSKPFSPREILARVQELINPAHTAEGSAS